MEGPRSCTTEEFGQTMELLDLLFKVDRGYPPGMAHDSPYVYNPRNVGRMQIIKDNGLVVSHIVIWPIRMTIEGVPFKVGELGGVGTHPRYRGKGYSTILLKHCVKVMESEGFDFSVLWTGIPDFYRRVGWELGGKVLNYVIPREKAAELPDLRDCAVTWKLSEADWEGLDLIRQSMPVSTIRLPGWTETVVQARHGLVLMAKREGRLVGYTLNRGNEIMEFGGEPQVVAGLIRLRFDLYHAVTHISLPRTPPGETASFLDSLGFSRQEAPLGMLRLIRPAQVVEKLGIPDMSVRQVGESVLLKWQEREFRLDQLQLVRFFFTADKELPPRPEGLPVFPYCWLLDHV